MFRSSIKRIQRGFTPARFENIMPLRRGFSDNKGGKEAPRFSAEVVESVKSLIAGGDLKGSLAKVPPPSALSAATSLSISIALIIVYILFIFAVHRGLDFSVLDHSTFSVPFSLLFSRALQLE